MSQNEEQVDSDQPDGRTILLESEYIKLTLHHVRLRRALLTDFRWFNEQLKLAREGTHSNRTDIINGLLDYIERSVPELEKALKHLEDQMEAKTIHRLKQIIGDETTSGLPRKGENPADKITYKTLPKDSRLKA